jgi:hypothetical protein
MITLLFIYLAVLCHFFWTTNTQMGLPEFPKANFKTLSRKLAAFQNVSIAAGIFFFNPWLEMSCHILFSYYSAPATIKIGG